MVLSGNPFRFGVFELNPQTGELYKEGVRVRLYGQPLHLLAILLEHAGQAVSREQLQKSLWPGGTFVDFEHGLNAAVKRLREALGDSADHPLYIETLPRHGYRFIALMDGKEHEKIRVRQAPEPPVPRKTPLAKLLLLFLIIAAAAFLAVRWSVTHWQRPVAESITTLGVLPMGNLSNDPGQEIFADGLTQALITELGRVPSVRVLSHQSMLHYKGSTKTIPQIAAELHANALLEGSTLIDGNHVRICAQLIRAQPEEHLWAASYDREARDMLGVQREVAQSIVAEVKTRFPMRPAER